MAHIIDIKNIDINNIDSKRVFAIDTNVLIWTHYSKASDPNLNKHPYQVVEYPNFIVKLLQNGNRLVTTSLNITELCNVVEKNEYKLYKIINGQRIGVKDFRRIADQRSNYKAEIDTMILEIKSLYDNPIKSIDINESMIANFRENVCRNRCDIFDYAAIEYLKSVGVTDYISDDKDFETIEGINLYTTYEES